MPGSDAARGDKVAHRADHLVGGDREPSEEEALLSDKLEVHGVEYRVCTIP
jgi:hypothetical protein